MRISEVTYGKLKTPLKVNGNLKLYEKINYSVESRVFNLQNATGTVSLIMEQFSIGNTFDK